MSDAGGRGPSGALRRVARRFRGAPAPLTVDDRLHRWARRIDEFHVVDREYFETLVGREFATDLEAIEFYVFNDKGRGLTLTPLIEPEWLRPQQPDEGMSWYDFLHQESPELVSTSPIFDAAVFVESLPVDERPTTTLDALRIFAATAGDDTPMPTPPERPGARITWGQARAEAMAHVTAFAAAQRRTRRRYRREWGGADEAAARARYADGLARLAAERPLVSIVLPTHDRETSLALALDSVVAQTYDNWQLVVVDDGSTDGTPELLEARAAADTRILVVRQPAQGAAAARNAALDAATGSVVAFLDSDNAWRPTHLEIGVAALLQSEGSSVFTGLRMIGANSARDDDAVSYRGESGTWDDLLAGNYIDLNALVVTAAAIEATSLTTGGSFDTGLRRWIDYDFLLRLAQSHGVPEYVDHLTVDYDNRFDAARLSSREGASWQDVAVAPALIDWSRLEAEQGARDTGLVSIVMPVYREWTMTKRAIEAVLADADSTDDASAEAPSPRVEVVVVDNASQRGVSAILGAWFGSEPRVRLIRTDRNLNFGLGSDLGFAASAGSVVVMLNNDTEVQPGWLPPLVAPLADDDVLGVQPLLLYPEGTVQAAGTIFGGDKVLPWHFLAGHARVDVDRADQRSFRAITAAAAAFRAADLIRWRGFDPVFANGLEDVDLCLRALDERPSGRFAVVLDSIVIHHESKSPGRDDARIANRRLFDERWASRYPADEAAARYEAAGLVYAGIQAGEPKGHDVMVRSSQPIVLRPEQVVAHGLWAGRPALRWALKASQSAAAQAEASVFASALRELGQEVVIDEPGAFYRSSCSLDDVCVAIVEDDRFVPQPGAVNVLWDPARVSDDLTPTSFAIHADATGVVRSPAATSATEALVLEALVRIAPQVAAQVAGR